MPGCHFIDDFTSDAVNDAVAAAGNNEKYCASDFEDVEKRFLPYQ
jgi:hypothetical protein